MCIAIYSPKGNPVPCEEYLMNSFIWNPDGAGFAYNTPNHTVHIEKGFMDYNKFIKAFRKANKKYNFKDCGVLIHFRISTHGGTNKECCHPFPLVADEKIMKRTSVNSNYAVIHNGVIHLTGNETYGRYHMSDTMVFIEKYLSKIATNKKWFNNKANFDMIYDLIESKMAILNGYGEVHATPGFTKDKDGNWYSNTSYKEGELRITKYNQPITVRGHCYDDDDEFENAVSLPSLSGYTTIKPAAKTTPKSEKQNQYYTPVMKLQDDMFCELSYFETIDRRYTYDWETFITEDGLVFQAHKEDLNDITKFVSDPQFLDQGYFFYKENYTPVDFVGDYRILSSSAGY